MREAKSFLITENTASNSLTETLNTIKVAAAAIAAAEQQERDNDVSGNTKEATGGYQP